MSVRGWKLSPLNRSSVCRILYDGSRVSSGWNATRSAFATTSMALLLAKRWQFEGLSTGFDHVVRQPCNPEHVNKDIRFLWCDGHLGDLVHDPAPAVVDLGNHF